MSTMRHTLLLHVLLLHPLEMPTMRQPTNISMLESSQVLRRITNRTLSS